MALLTNFVRIFSPQNEGALSFSEKSRLPYIITVNVVIFIGFIALFVLRMCTGTMFDVLNIGILVLLPVIIVSLTLLKKGSIQIAVYLSTGVLFLIATLALFALPNDGSVNSAYGGLAVFFAFAICNQSISIRKGQLFFMFGGTLIAWIFAFLSVYRPFFETSTNRVFVVFFVGILAIVIVHIIILRLNSFVEHLSETTMQELKNMTESKEQAALLLENVRNTLQNSKAVAEAVIVVERSLSTVDKIYSSLSSSSDSLSNESEAVKVSAGTVKNKADSMKGTIQGQNAAITETSAALTEISANLTSISDIAGKRRKSMESILHSLDSQKNLVKRLLDEVGNVQKSSEGIISFVHAVEDIASQTGLLAMNASIEAAHAGSSGKGFAVIAQEIRKLSEETRKNASLISDVFKKNEEIVQSAANSVTEFATHIERTADDTKSTISAIEEILSGVTEMDIGTRDVMKSVQNIVDGTRDTTALVEGVVSEIEEQTVAFSNISNFSNSLHTYVSSLEDAIENIKMAVSVVSSEVDQTNNLSKLLETKMRTL